MREVEIKGWVDDYRGVKARLDEEADLVGQVTKRDLYYGPDGIPARSIDLNEDPVFRLRSAGDAWLVTCKVRQFDEEVEVNDEVEFAVSDAASFRAFAQHIGFRPFIVKRKRTRQYRVGEALVELSKLDPLGDFLEVEIALPDDASADEVRAARDEVRALLLRFGVPEERIETRPYVDLLRKIGAGRPDP